MPFFGGSNRERVPRPGFSGRLSPFPLAPLARYCRNATPEQRQFGLVRLSDLPATRSSVEGINRGLPYKYSRSNSTKVKIRRPQTMHYNAQRPLLTSPTSSVFRPPRPANAEPNKTCQRRRRARPPHVLRELPVPVFRHGATLPLSHNHTHARWYTNVCVLAQFLFERRHATNIFQDYHGAMYRTVHQPCVSAEGIAQWTGKY